MYKNTDVFLNAEDSAKIAPYINIPEGWEWWYAKQGADVWILRKTDGMYVDTSAPEAIDEEIIREENILLTPAIDCGLLLRQLAPPGRDVRLEALRDEALSCIGKMLKNYNQNNPDRV